MLVLTRKLQEKIRIGDDITITVLKLKGKSVRLGIEAPSDVPVVRGELPAAQVDRATTITAPPVACQHNGSAGKSATDRQPNESHWRVAGEADGEFSGRSAEACLSAATADSGRSCASAASPPLRGIMAARTATTP